MSRRSLGRSLLDILRTLGVSIDKQAELAVLSERDAHPEATTEDIVYRLSLAPPELVEKAKEIAKNEGSVEMMHDVINQAKVETRDQSKAAGDLGEVAARIAGKA